VAAGSLAKVDIGKVENTQTQGGEEYSVERVLSVDRYEIV
jgi:hypothetical protein